MKVTVENQPTQVPFSSLKEGDGFRFENGVYIKTRQKLGTYASCISIFNHEIPQFRTAYFIDDETLVTPVKVIFESN